MLIRAALLDYNGTCIDDTLLSYESCRGVFRHYGITPIPTFEQFREDISSNYMDDFYRKYGLPADISQKDVNDLRSRYYREHFNEVGLKGDLFETISRLKSMGLVVGIVSAEVRSLLTDKLCLAGMLPLFSLIKCDCTDKEAAFREVVAELKVFPSQVIYVDDSVDGNRAARNSGLIPIGITGGVHSADKLRKYAAYIVNNLSEVVSIVGCSGEIEGFPC